MKPLSALACVLPVLLLASAAQDPIQRIERIQGTPVRGAGRMVDKAKQDPAPIYVDEGKLVVARGEHTLEALIAASSQFLEMNFLVDEIEMQQSPRPPVAITHPLVLDRDGCFDTLSAMLHSNGRGILSMDRDRGLYEIVLLAGSRRAELSSNAEFVPIEQVGQYAKRYVQIITTVPLEHINATVANNALRPFFAQGGRGGGLNVGNIGDQRSLILQGLGPQVFAAVKLAKITDLPPRQDGRQQAAMKALIKRVEALEKALQAQSKDGSKSEAGKSVR